MRYTPFPLHRTHFARLLFLLALALLPREHCPAADPGGNSAAALQSLVRRWVNLRREKNAAETQWEHDRPLLEDELRMLRKQRESLEHEIQALTPANTEAETQLAELREADRAAGEMLAELTATVQKAESSLLQIEPSLPAFLRTRLAADFHALTPESAAYADAGERLRRVLDILTALDEANRQFHVVDVILTPPTETRREMRVLYAGLSRAFAVSPDGHLAAIGTPAASGWEWQWDQSIAAAVQTAIRIAREEESARFATLPFHVTSPHKHAAPESETSAP